MEEQFILAVLEANNEPFLEDTIDDLPEDLYKESLIPQFVEMLERSGIIIKKIYKYQLLTDHGLYIIVRQGESLIAGVPIVGRDKYNNNMPINTSLN